MPEEPFLYDKLSGREFLEFAAEMRRAGPRRPWTASSSASARTSSLEDFLDDLTETYSHGMKQRLVFAAALLHDPPVLVVDEPMVGLDPRSVRVVKDRLRTEAAAGSAVFMSTHTLAVAEEIADRIGIMDHGRLHFLGTVSELQHELASHHTSLEPLFLELTEERQRIRQKAEGRREWDAARRKPTSGVQLICSKVFRNPPSAVPESPRTIDGLAPALHSHASAQPPAHSSPPEFISPEDEAAGVRADALSHRSPRCCGRPCRSRDSAWRWWWC